MLDKSQIQHTIIEHRLSYITVTAVTTDVTIYMESTKTCFHPSDCFQIMIVRCSKS